MFNGYEDIWFVCVAADRRCLRLADEVVWLFSASAALVGDVLCCTFVHIRFCVLYIKYVCLLGHLCASALALSQKHITRRLQTLLFVLISMHPTTSSLVELEALDIFLETLGEPSSHQI